VEYAKIWAATIVLACVYGIAHDQVTAHLCVEYFTVAHVRVFPTDSATLLAFGWGIIATWWVGAAARLGPLSRVDLRDIIRPGLAVLCLMALCSLAAGVAGYAAAATGAVDVPSSVAGDIPLRSHDRFIAVWWAHQAAYASGALGALVLTVGLFVSRGRSGDQPNQRHAVVYGR
jgi:hypothetical protein